MSGQPICEAGREHSPAGSGSCRSGGLRGARRAGSAHPMVSKPAKPHVQHWSWRGVAPPPWIPERSAPPKRSRAGGLHSFPRGCASQWLIAGRSRLPGRLSLVQLPDLRAKAVARWRAALGI